jgi:hypothetical protein
MKRVVEAKLYQCVVCGLCFRAAIDFRCAPDEVADLAALIREIRRDSRVRQRLH